MSLVAECIGWGRVSTTAYTTLLITLFQKLLKKLTQKKEFMKQKCKTGCNFKGYLIFFEKNVKTENYLEDIFFISTFIEDADRCWGVGNWIFQQGNAPAHRSAETKVVLSELCLRVLEWPPYSPDLIVIEIVWAIMEAEVEERNPSSVEELKTIVSDIWEKLKWPTINELIDSIEERLAKVHQSPDKTIYNLYH